MHGWEAPRILAYHGSTFNGQRSHPHPRLTPDGRHVLYTSDVSGYANLYLAPVGDLDDLPVLDLETGLRFARDGRQAFRMEAGGTQP